MFWGTPGLIGLGNGLPGLPVPAEFGAFGLQSLRTEKDTLGSDGFSLGLAGFGAFLHLSDRAEGA